MQLLQTLTGIGQPKKEATESKETVIATAQIKTIPDDEKSCVNALQLEVSGTINTGSGTKEASKRCIIFVIDKSGSMSGSRINTVREAVIPFIEEYCENDNIMIKLILFASSAYSHDIPKDRSSARTQLETVLNAGGGTDFARASDTLVSVGEEVLTQYREHEMTVIICSDGEVSKSNAQQAHKTWKKFVNSKYMKIHKQFPFVESIGISSNHDADILDGFIMNDDNGNYTRANDSNGIRETFERAAENATMRETYKIRISANNNNISFIDSLFHRNNVKCKEYTLSQSDFLLKVWIDKKALNLGGNKEDLMIIINDDTKVNVIMNEMKDCGKVQEYIIDYYHQILKDMINALRNIQDEASLKQEAHNIENILSKYASIFVEITAQPSELAQLENQVKELLQHCDDDKIEERALRLKHYKKVRASWKGHRVIVTQLNNTLKSLRDLLQEILTGKTRMQEIRQHILDLHFSKKHAKRMSKLILTDEQLAKRQHMYDNIKSLNDDDIKELSDDLGSGCFLSTMTLRDCAADGQALWLCGRVNRSGGIMVSNPEVIRIEYISPDLVSNEYFEMAMDIQSEDGGFYDGSRNIINARLCPIYGDNMDYVKMCRPYLFEALSHTLSGRNDIKINDYSTLSAVLGHMIASHKQSTNNLNTIFGHVLPSYTLLAKYVRVFPYKNDKNKEIEVKATNKILLFDLFKQRLQRYCNGMRVRCSSLISNVQCLFGDALMTNDYSLLLQAKQSEIVWFCMIAQRLRSLIKNRIPGDQSLFTKAREAEVNHCQALRVIIRGTDHENDVFDDNKDDDDADATMLHYFEAQYKIEKELKKERLAPFDIAECKSLKSDDIDFSAFDAYKMRPSQIQICAQILSRVHWKDLVQAHRFFRILNEIKSDNDDIVHNIDKFKLKFDEDNVGHTLTDFCGELRHPLSMMTLRALCGFVLMIHSNSLFQNTSNCGLFEELLSKPSVIIQFLHEKVIAEAKRKPRRMVARIKHKPSSPVDFAKRSEHGPIFPHWLMDKNSSYWNDIDLCSAPQYNVAIVGHHKCGKSSMMGRLLFDLGAVSREFCRNKQCTSVHMQSENEFSKIVHNKSTTHEVMTSNIKSADSSCIIRLNDTPNPLFYKNVIKTFAAMNGVILCVPSSMKAFAESVEKRNVKKGIIRSGGTLSLPHCIRALMSTEIIICCITMMDQVKYSEFEYSKIKNEMTKILCKRGYKEKKLIFIPICSLNSDNISICSLNMEWYKGFEITIKKKKYNGQTLYDSLNLLTQLNVDKSEKPFAFLVIAKYRIKGVGFVIIASVIQGRASVGDEIKFIPSDVTANIKSMQKNHENVKQCVAQDIVAMALNVTNKKTVNHIMVGDIASFIGANLGINARREINVLVFVCASNIVNRIRNGYCGNLFLASDHVPCSVKQIEWKIASKSTNNKKINSPTYIEAGDQAQLILSLQKPMAVAKYDQFKTAGRFVVVSGDSPVFYGKIC